MSAPVSFRDLLCRCDRSASPRATLRSSNEATLLAAGSSPQVAPLAGFYPREVTTRITGEHPSALHCFNDLPKVNDFKREFPALYTTNRCWRGRADQRDGPRAGLNRPGGRSPILEQQPHEELQPSASS